MRRTRIDFRAAIRPKRQVCSKDAKKEQARKINSCMIALLFAIFDNQNPKDGNNSSINVELSSKLSKINSRFFALVRAT